DEALFCLGLRAYDVTSHHPHPPGFPIYIAAAKIARVFTHDDFRALQAVNLIAAMLLFPAVFLLARELRMRFETSLVAGLLCAFLPNVWFFGGTAFSDVPSIVLVVFAAAMLFRGCRDANAYLIGAFLLALACGIRPQNILVGLVPGTVATWYRARASFRDVVFAALIGAATVALAFGSAIHATGTWQQFMESVRTHGDYIARVDSWRAPGRPPLWRLFAPFFLQQYQFRPLSIVMSIFVIVSAIGAIRQRDRAVLLAFLTFAPFAVLAWMMLDRFSINRFSIGYCPMFALLAADGIARAAGHRARLELAVGLSIAGGFAAWTWPALETVRREVSPPAQAMQTIRERLDRRRDHLFVAFGMVPFMEYFNPYFPFQRVNDEHALPLSIASRRPWLVAEVDPDAAHGLTFRRDRGRLWNITRRHYFAVSLMPLRDVARFGAGWYPPERSGAEEWRWMAGHSVTELPPVPGTAHLHLDLELPDETLPLHPTLTIMINGTIIDRFRPTEARLTRDYDVQLAPGTPNVLELDVDRTVNPARAHASDDDRDLGLLVRSISWGG
ncbi:MAG TPA: hypothetical protein VJ276_23030, partial [Thermoanaerobaculia bacterium]|nr:hypothetical protein [Thermoanaerobaculia bacterium]